MTRRLVNPEDLAVQVEELSRIVAAQQAELDALRADRRLDAHPGPAGAVPPDDRRDSRRGFLLRAGAAAVGAATVGLAAESSRADAAASDPYPQYVSDAGDT